MCCVSQVNILPLVENEPEKGCKYQFHRSSQPEEDDLAVYYWQILRSSENSKISKKYESIIKFDEPVSLNSYVSFTDYISKLPPTKKAIQDQQ